MAKANERASKEPHEGESLTSYLRTRTAELKDDLKDAASGLVIELYSQTQMVEFLLEELDNIERFHKNER